MKKEGDIESKCVTVCAIDEKAEEIDLKLRKLLFDKFDTLSHHSRMNDEKNQRKEALTLNRLKNVKMRYEIIKKAHVKEIVKMKGVEMTFRKALSSAQVNGVNMFQAAEQGHGQNKEDVYVYFHPEHKKLVMKWFNDLFVKGTSLKHEREIETSIAK